MLWGQQHSPQRRFCPCSVSALRTLLAVISRMNGASTIGRGRGYNPDATAPKDGVSIKWKQPVEGRYGGYRPSPLIANGIVYGFSDGIVGVSASTGKLRFRLNAPAGPGLIVPSSVYSVPTLAVATQNTLYGLDAHGGVDIAGHRIGKRRWQLDRKSQTQLFGFRSPPTAPITDGQTVFATLSSTLFAVEPNSGRVRWQNYGGNYRPSVSGETVYVATFNRGLIGYDTETSTRTFHVPPETFRSTAVTATAEQLVVSTDSGLAGVAHDESILWRYEPPEMDRDYGSVAVAEGTAYTVFRGEKDTYLVAVSVEDGTERWRTTAPLWEDPPSSQPTIADGVVYLPLSDGGTVALDAGDGHTRWEFIRGERGLPWSPAAIADGTLYTLGNGHLYALEER